MAAAKAKAAAKAAASHKKPTGASSGQASAAAKSEPAALPPKDQKVFKEILNLYETKQYRKGLKHCEGLLKKYPDHGETIAMSGLFHHSLNDKQLGYDLVKKGVRAQLKSHIVWHVYGIMTRADRNYEEALKCYAQAHRLDPENIHILRDLSLLQVQLRQFRPYLISRHQFLRANWKTRQQWLALALAYHLASQPSDALDVLLALESAQSSDSASSRCYEISETVLFTAHVASTIPGKEEWVLEYLEERSGKVVDRTAFMVARARILGKLGRTEAAEWGWTALLEPNPDSLEFIGGYVELKGCSLSPASSSDESRAATLNVLQTLRSRYPKSLLINRLVLEFSDGAAFDEEVSAYLLNGLRRGVPSLFNDVKKLCASPAKAASIRRIVESFRSTLDGRPSDADDEEEAPSTYLWTLYFLSQLYSLLSLHDLSLSTVRLALSHTPSLPDTYHLLSRSLKRSGSPSLAALAIEEARLLDGQDRFLNGKSAKYALRAARSFADVEDVRRKVGVFTRKEAPDPAADLVDMQALWYVLEEAEAFARIASGEGGEDGERRRAEAMALKRFQQTADVFATWVDDQFDFHSYCVRKNTLRVYLELLEKEDRLFDNPQYLRAATGAIRIYLDLHDRRKHAKVEVNGASGAEGEHGAKVNGVGPGVDAGQKEAEKGESKKAAKKAKQAEAKAKAAEAKKASAPASTAAGANKDEGKDADGLPIPPDEDPLGEKLAATEDPVGAALTFWRPLGQMCAGRLETWLLAVDIDLARGKPLLAVKAFKQARELVDHDDARLHVPLTRLFSALTDPAPLAEPVKLALQDELSSLTPHKSLSDANDAFLASHPTSPSHALAVLDSLVLLPDPSAVVVDQVETIAFDRLLDGEDVEWPHALAALRGLRKVRSGKEEEFRERAGKRWDLVEGFWRGGEERREREERERKGFAGGALAAPTNEDATGRETVEP